MKSTILAYRLKDAATFHRRGDFARAERLYRSILKSVSDQPDALHLLGLLLAERGEQEKGVRLIRRAIFVKPYFPDAHFNLGRIIAAQGDGSGAKLCYESALAQQPAHAKALNGLGVLYREQSQHSQAIEHFKRAIKLDPRLIEAYVNLCNTFRDCCDDTGVLTVTSLGLDIDPNCVQLRLMRAEALFTTGALTEGWCQYEWRFLSARNPVPKQHYALPLWEGEDLACRSILVWSEQGVGDEILFLSLLSELASRAKLCILQTTPRLVNIVTRSLPTVQVYGSRISDDVVQLMDFQCPLGSIGRWLRPTFSTFTSSSQYLYTDVGLTKLLRAKYLAGRQSRPIVGLAWRSSNVSDAAEKSVSLLEWGPILKVPGITFVNLQYGDSIEEISAVRKAFGADIIFDPDIDPLDDIDAFAAQVGAMDLVISSSNTAAHVAGAIGVPTWCIIPRALGRGRRWYWFGQGVYSPWYRSMLLFRKTEDSWESIIRQVGLELEVSFVRTQQGHEAPSHQELLPQTTPPSAQMLRDAAKASLLSGDLAEARSLIEQAIARNSTSPDFHNIHGMILVKMGHFLAGAASYRRALKLAPQAAEIFNNLGTAMCCAGYAQAAYQYYSEAHRLKPDHPEVFLNYASALLDINRLDEALAGFDKLLTLRPDYADAHYNRALALLALGRLEEGWASFKWRLKRHEIQVRHDNFPQPVWNGESIQNKNVLVWTEIGLGEELLLASMLPDIAATAKRVTLLCSERLIALFRRSFPEISVDRRTDPLPPCAVSVDIDFQMSISELGLLCRRRFDEFPDRKRFLSVDCTLRDALRRKYRTGPENYPLVGISWRSSNPEIGAQKSIPLEAWLPVLRQRGMTFVNLQYGNVHEELELIRKRHAIEIINDPEIDLFGDLDMVAAQVAAMDHVITISNTTAHLAGALGVPTWIFLPYGHARLWYWFRGLERCPWYPNAKLIPSSDKAGWPELMLRCATHLQLWAQSRNSLI